MKPAYLKALLAVLLIAILYATGYTQTNSATKITGNIKNNLGVAVENATILLVRSSDSISVGGSITNKEGIFSIKVAKPGSYLLVCTKLGYEKLYSSVITIASGQDDYKVETLILNQSTTDLGEVVVKSRKPLVQMDDDKLVFNVDSDPDLKGRMATDALRKTPFVVIDGDGTIKMAGKKSLRILLNGKSTGLVAFSPGEVLKRFQPI